MADELPSPITDNCLSLDFSFLACGLHRHVGGEGKGGQVNVRCDIPERKQSKEWYQMWGTKDKNGLSFIVHLFYKNKVMISDYLGWYLNNTDWVLFPAHELNRETYSFECIMHYLFIYLKNSLNLQSLSKLRVLS